MRTPVAKPIFKPVGSDIPECPYCAHNLGKKPDHSMHCPQCGELIYVRVRPTNCERVLVADDELEELARQRILAGGVRAVPIKKGKRFNRVRSELLEKFGQDVSDNDVYWAIYNADLHETASNGDWGLSRNTRFHMAELLRSEGRGEEALDLLLEVSYLDSNGPMNLGSNFDRESPLQFPAFDREMAFQAPGIVHRISVVQNYYGLDNDSLKSNYFSRAGQIHQQAGTPKTPEEGWDDLIGALTTENVTDQLVISPEKRKEGKEEIRSILINCARAQSTCTYSELVNSLITIRLHPDSYTLAEILGEILREEDAAGRGKLTFLIHHRSSDKYPGREFFELAGRLGRETSGPDLTWSSEVSKVHAYWAAQSET